MKYLMVIGFISLAFCLSTNAERQRHDRRQIRQNARFEKGEDELTHAERKKLRKSKRAIRRTEKAAEKDGVVTDQEKQLLERQQDRRSKQIYRLKHNDQKPDEAPTGENP